MIIMLKEDGQKQPNESQGNTDKNTWEDKETTKWAKRVFQQTSTWNQGNYKI
jgi:hypothetical protein